MMPATPELHKALPSKVYLLRQNGALVGVFSTENKALVYMRTHRKKQRVLAHRSKGSVMNMYRITVSSLASDYYMPGKRKLIADATARVWANSLNEACEYVKRKFSDLGCTPVQVSQAWVIWPTPLPPND